MERNVLPLKEASERIHRVKLARKDIIEQLGRNPSKDALYSYYGFSNEEWRQNLPTDTRSLLHEDLDEYQVREICD